MSSIVMKKPRVLQSARAIIMGSHNGTPEFLLGQRSKVTTNRHQRMLECFGGTLLDKDGRFSKGLFRENLEETGIKINKVISEVYTEHRKWEANGSAEAEYDEYEVKFFLVDTPTIKEVRLSPEHSGYGWFPMPFILLNKKVIRPSTHRAFEVFCKEFDPVKIAALLTVNPKHH